MTKKIKHIVIIIVTGVVLLLLTVANASAQQHVIVDQCDTMEFEVTSRPNIPETHFDWGIYNSSSDPTDVLDPNTTLDPVEYFVGDNLNTGRKVTVAGLQPGIYYVRIRVEDEVSCTDNVEMYVMEVIENIPEIALVGDSACIGEATSVRIIFTGVGPYTIDYSYGDEITGNVVNMNGVLVDGPEAVIPITQPLPVGEATFWVISVEDGCKPYEFPIDERPSTGVLIYPKPTKQPIYLKED